MASAAAGQTLVAGASQVARAHSRAAPSYHSFCESLPCALPLACERWLTESTSFSRAAQHDHPSGGPSVEEGLLPAISAAHGPSRLRVPKSSRGVGDACDLPEIGGDLQRCRYRAVFA